MMKMNFTNNQVAFDYVLYMIVGSYFDKTTCDRAQLQEKKMFLQYKEQKLNNQFAMEDACIVFAEQELLPNIPEKFWEQQAEVRIRKRTEDGSLISFEGKDFRLICQVELSGKRKAEFTAWFCEKGKEPVALCKELPVKAEKGL